MIGSALRVTGACPDGSAVIAALDLPLVPSALIDGIPRRGAKVSTCKRCSPGVTCGIHRGDAQLRDPYRSLAMTIGAAR
jgi:hypothetical protein